MVCWDFCTCVHQGIWPVISPFVVPLSGFDTVMLTQENKVRRVPSHLLSGRVEYDRYSFFFKYLGKCTMMLSDSGLSFVRWFLVTASVPLLAIHLFTLSLTKIQSSRFYISKNVSIYCRLFNLLVHNCSLLSPMILWISVVSVAISLLFIILFIWSTWPIYL